jgi:hypothetical protein
VDLSQEAPWVGLAPYRPETAHLFFGRDVDRSLLGSMVLAHRLSLLHAPSGAGKSSLLHAAMIPELEGLGWLVATTRPWFDPIDEVRDATLRALFPDPQFEVAAIDRAVRMLSRHGRDENPPLRDLVCDVRAALETPGGHAFREMLEPFSTGVSRGEGAQATSVTPFFVRCLHGRGAELLLARHLRACDALALDSGRSGLGSVAEALGTLARTRLSDLRAIFLRTDYVTVRQQLLAFLQEPGLSLAAFFRRLVELWGSHFEDFGVVVVIDQFEEVFTRFVEDTRASAREIESGADADECEPGGPAWQKRRPFFQALAEVLAAGPLADAGLGDTTRLPVRVLLAMRDDHVADLDQLMRFTGPIRHEARYRLRWLDPVGAEAALDKPAWLFGWPWDPEVKARLLGELRYEDEWYQPAQIQIVCTRLWQWTSDHPGRPLTIDVFDEELGGIKGVVQGYLREVIERDLAIHDDLSRCDALDLLEPLITQRGRRNIVEAQVLTDAPYRVREQRRSLLELLERRRIVRTEWRLRSRFVEFTHETLIPPALALIEQYLGNQRWRDLRAAIQRLRELELRGFRGADVQPLGREQLEALLWYEPRLDFARYPWIAEVLYRASIWHGMPPDIQARCRGLFERLPSAFDADALWEGLADRARIQRWFDAVELRVLHDDEVTRRAVRAKPPGDATFLLGSALRNCGAPDEDIVVHWTRRALS